MKTLRRYGMAVSAVLLSGIFTASAAITLEWAVVDDAGDGVPLTAFDPAGSLYVANRSAGSNNVSRFTLAKYTSGGARLWLRHYEGPGRARNSPAAMALNAAGDVYITGNADFGPNGNSDIGLLTVKYDAEGNLLWAVRRDEPSPNRNYARALALDAEGNIWVSALTLAGGQQIPTVLTVKYDPQGRELWVSYLTAGGASPFGLALDAAGNGYLTGFANIRCGVPNEDECLERGFTTKIGADGRTRWVRYFDVPGRSARFQALAVDRYGRATVTGSIWGGNNTNTEALTVQYAPHGERLWVARNIDPTGMVLSGQLIGTDAVGNVYVTSTAFTTVKYNAIGQLLWRRTEADYVVDMTVDASGNVYAIGRGFSRSPEALFAVKYDTCGNRRWSFVYNTNDSALELAADVVLGPAGRVHLNGLLSPSSSTPGSFGTLLLALSQTDEPLPPAVSIRATRALTIEGGRGVPPAMLTVSREGPTTGALQVHLSISGTALSGTDYRAIADVITIPSGQASATIQIQVIDDRLREKTETLRVELFPDPAYSLCDRTHATIYIFDNEPRFSWW